MSPTPPQDDQAPATRKELDEGIQLIMGTLLDMENRMTTKEDLQKLKEEMLKEIHEEIGHSERRMIVLMEDWRHDMVGVHKDKISQHEDRITRLEEHTGVAV